MVKFLHMKQPNIYTSSAFSFVTSFPKELDIMDKIDYDEQFEKSFSSPIRFITEKIRWKIDDSYGTYNYSAEYRITNRDVFLWYDYELIINDNIAFSRKWNNKIICKIISVYSDITWQFLLYFTYLFMLRWIYLSMQYQSNENLKAM